MGTDVRNDGRTDNMTVGRPRGSILETLGILQCGVK